MKVLCHIAIHLYYVGFISKYNGIIGADAVRPPVLFEDCGKTIASGGASSYLRCDGGDGLCKFDLANMLLN